VVLDLEEEVLGPEDLAELQRGVFGFLIVVRRETLRDLAFEARREDDQSLAMFAQESLSMRGLVEALGIPGGRA
jgi:hypothetical protein